MPGRVRVLHLAAGNLFGGVETLLCTLARYRSAERRLDSDFALCFEGRLSEELRRLEQPAHLLGGVRLRHPPSVARANWKLSALLRRSRYDAVVTHGAWPHLLFGPCAKLHGLKLVEWGHGAPLQISVLDRLAAYVRPDLLIANSQHTLAALGQRVHGVQSTVIYAPVAQPAPAAKSRAELRRELNAPEDAVVILFAARLERWKGHELLLSAAARLAALGAEFRIWLCGGAQRPHEQVYLSELKQLAAHAGLSSRISFLGERSDVPALMQAADLFCQPNLGPEPFGIVFVEALYAGLPIVTTALGGAMEIVDASCGLLAEPEPSAVAAALGRLITNASLRQSLGQAAPARARLLCDPEARMDDIARAISA
jgi:glycosyltransferase involved in cell wall biosynthesis